MGFTTSSSILTSPPCRFPANSGGMCSGGCGSAIGSGALKMHRLLATSTPANQPSTMRGGRRGGHWSNSGQTSNRRLMGEPRRRGSQLKVRKLWTMVLRVTATNSITSDVRDTHRRHNRCGPTVWPSATTRGVAWAPGACTMFGTVANCTTGRRRAPCATARHNRWQTATCRCVGRRRRERWRGCAGSGGS